MADVRRQGDWREVPLMRLIALAVIASMFFACGGVLKNSERQVVAKLEPKSRSRVHGRVTLTPDPDQGVVIHVSASGLTPNGEHGFHIHRIGDCAAPDAGSAGEHFSPEKNPHGDPLSGPHHAGDLRNLKADAYGRVDAMIVARDINLKKGDPYSVLGRSVVIHEKADDYASQPSGDSGRRIACAVIR